MEVNVIQFTLDAAKQLFLTLDDKDLSLTNNDVEQAFIFSLMTVRDEQKNLGKYYYLTYIEFIEMMCRLALEGAMFKEPVEYKVNFLLNIIYEKMYADHTWNTDDHMFYSIHNN